MLYKYTCKSMGLTCPFMATDASLEEVTKQALVHVREMHIKEFNHVESPEEIERMSKSLERSIRVVME